MATTLGQLNPTFNTGNNILVRLVDNNGAVISLGMLQDFEDTPERDELTIAPINSPYTLHQSIPKGHKGKITVFRQDNTLDILQSQIEGRFFAGQPSVLYTIYITVANPNGITNEYAFTGADLWVTTLGNFARDKEVMQTIEYTAQLMSVIE